jgi:4-hydroxybenzoate polyprenyltransferase
MAPVLGASLAIGIDWKLIYVFIWGGLVHLTGFGLNNWFDRDYDLGKQHSNPIAKGLIRESTAIYVIAAIWLAMWILPLLFIETNLVAAYVPILFMTVLGTAYDAWSKKYMISPGVFLGGWVMFLTICGYAFFNDSFIHSLIILAFVAFMQCWCQWVEGLLKDKDTDPHNLASILNGWKWDTFFFGSLIAQILAIDLLLWKMHPQPLYGILSLTFIILSVLVWLAIALEKEREQILKLSGMHEILVFSAAVFALAPVIHEWAFVFILVPTAWYAVFNRTLYGLFGRPRI